jgi:endo-alpha-1,4-polygalactosaminidase (GH114 family)
MVAIALLVLAAGIGSVSAFPAPRKHRTKTSTVPSYTATSTAESEATFISTTAVVYPTTDVAYSTTAEPLSTTISSVVASATSSYVSPPASTGSAGVWQPAVGSKWQIQLSQVIKVDSTLDPATTIYDLDLFDTPKSSIDQLHALGKKVICYFSAGSFEPGRPDSAQFTASDKGSELDGWPGEYWLDLKSANVRAIMVKRLQLAASQGCDGVDPDNVDGYVSLMHYGSQIFLSLILDPTGEHKWSWSYASRFRFIRPISCTRSSIS